MMLSVSYTISPDMHSFLSANINRATKNHWWLKITWV